jgi:hypothetical protein
MSLKIYGPKGDPVSVIFELLLEESKKSVKFMIPTPKVPMVSAN